MTETTTERPVPTPRLKVRYREELAGQMREQFG
jgi:large subunit ribosomal protein L5